MISLFGPAKTARLAISQTPTTFSPSTWLTLVQEDPRLISLAAVLTLTLSMFRREISPSTWMWLPQTQRLYCAKTSCSSQILSCTTLTPSLCTATTSSASTWPEIQMHRSTSHSVACKFFNSARELKTSFCPCSTPWSLTSVVSQTILLYPTLDLTPHLTWKRQISNSSRRRWVWKSRSETPMRSTFPQIWFNQETTFWLWGSMVLTHWLCGELVVMALTVSWLFVLKVTPNFT
jgi:hypothetical protein